MKKLKLKPNQQGFTLIETMIAMAIIAIALLGCAALYMKSTLSNTSSNHYSSAAFIAKSGIDSYKNESVTFINNLSTGTKDPYLTDATGWRGVNAKGPLIFTNIVTVSDPEGGNGKIINYAVTWNDPTKGLQRVEYQAVVRGNGT